MRGSLLLTGLLVTTSEGEGEGMSESMSFQDEIPMKEKRKNKRNEGTHIGQNFKFVQFAELELDFGGHKMEQRGISREIRVEDEDVEHKAETELDASHFVHHDPNNQILAGQNNVGAEHILELVHTKTSTGVIRKNFKYI